MLTAAYVWRECPLRASSVVTQGEAFAGTGGTRGHALPAEAARLAHAGGAQTMGGSLNVAAARMGLAAGVSCARQG